MKKLNKLLPNISLFLGVFSLAFFVFDFLVFHQLQPKMILFQALSAAEENLMNWVGVGLLGFLVFCLLSLWQMAQYLKAAKKITFFSFLLIAGGVLSFLFVFSDVALLGDIGKQYRHGLSQPEWLLLYPLVLFQFLIAVLFTWLHFSGFWQKKQLKHVAQDSQIFLVVQYVGVICGFLGVSASFLGFCFPRAWNLLVHTLISSLILLAPYFLAVVFWLITKFGEKGCSWWDEKQFQDMGKAALLTLLLNTVFMIGLFFTNYQQLNGVVRFTWLPLYLFFVLFFFSLANLFFASRN